MKRARQKLAVLLAAASLSGVVAAAARAETQFERGRYLVTIMDCGGCHTTGGLVGTPDPAKYLAGAEVGWFVPDVGVLYPPNITPDMATGIGKWTEADIVKALKTGEIPGGRVLVPLMPWPAFSQASDADLEAMAFYLKRLPPVDHAVPETTALKDAKAPYFTVAVPPHS